MGAYNRNVLFIHIPKCGGWSVKTYMRDHLPGVRMPQDENGKVSPGNPSKLPLGHVRLADIERFTGRDPASFDLILATIRLPYEQQLSQWLFWLNRYHRGARHWHDRVAALYSTLTDFLLDPRCDFHVWYDHHFGGHTAAHRNIELNAVPRAVGHTYEAFGGIYRYWLEVDGQVPDNVRVVKLEELNEKLPAILQPYADHELPDVGKKNANSWSGEWPQYYTPQAVDIVNHKARWAFTWHYEPVSMEVET